MKNPDSKSFFEGFDLDFLARVKMIQHFRGDSPLQARGVLSGGKQNSFRSGYNPLLKCEASGGW